MNKPIIINRSDFLDYEEVRISAKANMFDVKQVSALSGLSREVIFEIIKNYNTLASKWPKVVQG